MSKKVTWDAPKLQNPNSPFLKGQKTFKEMWERGQKIEEEQQEAQTYLVKAMPLMTALLELKLRTQEPLIIMRPLRYQTSEISKETDDGFYKSRSVQNPKFKDVINVITPGTQLMLKSLDMALQEFIFEDASGKEYALNFSEKNNLMTQTNVFEEVKNYLETKGE